MGEPKTDTFDRLRKFMDLSPNQRDEALFLQTQRFKSILESEGIMKGLREMNEIVHGTKDQAGILLRIAVLEENIAALVKSNAKLQKALYVATGAYLAAKFYFEYLAPHKP
jgi:hypothetical protein